MNADDPDNSDDDQFGSLSRLWEVFLHMRAWGLPDYGELSEESRLAFTELVNTKTLFEYVEDCKRDLLRSGFNPPDEWLNCLYAGELQRSGQLSQSRRDSLGRMLTNMYPSLVRLDPDAQPKNTISDESNLNGDGLKVPARAQRAGQQYDFAMKQHFVDMNSPPSDIQVYSWLKEKLPYADREKLPGFQTWTRYLREWRNFTALPRHSRSQRQDAMDHINPFGSLN